MRSAGLPLACHCRGTGKAPLFHWQKRKNPPQLFGIDVAAEKDRLEKTLGKLEKDLGGLRGRLNNPKFMASAPEAVVAESRELMAQKEDEAAKLKAAMDRLAELG